MKHISDFIAESAADGKRGHWMYTVQNGKASSVWVDYDEIIAKRKAAEEAAKEAARASAAAEKKKIAEKKKAAAELKKVEDRMYKLNIELVELGREHRDLRIEMEEELGPLYALGTKEGEAQAEERAQYYGAELDKLEDKIHQLNSEYDSLEASYFRLENTVNS